MSSFYGQADDLSGIFCISDYILRVSIENCIVLTWLYFELHFALSSSVFCRSFISYSCDKALLVEANVVIFFFGH